MSRAHPGAPGALAQVIRKFIFQKTKLTASAGIGPNKLVAKIASDLNKPNGQFEVKPDEVAEFMAALPVRKIWGIGAVTEQKTRPARDQDLRRVAALFAFRVTEAIRQIRSRALRSLPRDRRSPGRAASRAQITQHRGNVSHAISRRSRPARKNSRSCLPISWPNLHRKKIRASSRKSSSN